MNHWKCFFMTALLSYFAVACLAEETTSTSPINHRPDCPRRCICNETIKEVTCHYKRLRDMPRGIPSWTRILSLTGNHIRYVPRGFFRRLQHLEEVNLNGNLLNKIPNFSGSKVLKKINLASNRINRIHKNALRNLHNLEILTLSKNKIGKFRSDTFEDLDRLVEIRLDGNELQTLETALFEKMSSLKILYVHNNRWHCDCHLKKLEQELRRKHIKHGFIICDSPSALDGQALSDIVATTLCGQDVETLIGALLGVLIGLIVFVFSIFICRKAASFVAQKEMAEKARHGSKKDDAKAAKTTKDDSVRSSIVSIG